MSLDDNKSLEPLFNDDLSTADGTSRNLRVYHPNQPLEGYHIVYQEDGSTSYFAYEDKDGAYYILRSVRVGAVVTYTYTAGTADVATAWTGKSGLTYALFSVTF